MPSILIASGAMQYVCIVHFGLCYLADTDVIEETIRENDLGCSVIRSRRDEECTSGDTDAQTTLQEVRGTIAEL